MSNYIQQKMIDVITIPCPNFSKSRLRLPGVDVVEVVVAMRSVMAALGMVVAAAVCDVTEVVVAMRSGVVVLVVAATTMIE